MNTTTDKRRQCFRIFINDIKKDYKNSPINLCVDLLSGKKPLPEFFKSACIEEKYYWIGNVYTGLIPESTKHELAAHFTPPHIAQYAITRAEQFGLDVKSSRILDPASGGAAFLTPLSSVIIKKLREQGKTDEEIGMHISNNLSGIEIDDNLSKLSGLILNDFVSMQLPTFKKKLPDLILNEDSLRVASRENQYDAIVSNPPYGKIRNPPVMILERFAHSLTDKHINKYALFIRLSIDWVKPGGSIVLVVPTSFISGPYFGNLRKSILEDAYVLAIDLIDKRENLFVDVLQDTCIVFLRKKNGQRQKKCPSCRFIHEDGCYREMGSINIPSRPSTRPWVLPCELSSDISTKGYFSKSYAKLADYGYGVRAGYFVWNRQKERCREERIPRRKNEYPLIWAHCIKANEPCRPSTHRIYGQPGLKSLVKFDTPVESLINKPSIILQRTTNRNQARRLIAGYISKSMINEYGSLISENHTIVVYPLPGVKQKLNLKTMCRLLNSKSVDMRYRQVSGTVSVSVKLLRIIPFPPPTLIMERLRANLTSDKFDAIVEDCYREAGRLKR